MITDAFTRAHLADADNVQMTHEKDDLEFLDGLDHSVRPIHTERRHTERNKPKPAVRMAERDEREAIREFRLGLDDALIESDEILSYRSDDLPAAAWGRLRRGELSVRDELDLHDLTLTQAQRILADFLRHAKRERHGCLLIIHGKGRGSESYPAIKNMVSQTLRHRADVLGFHSAPRNRGGEGAVIVVMRTTA